MRIIFINNIPAPFMVQFASKMNEFQDVDFYLVALNKEFKHRGKHWADTLSIQNNLFYYDGGIPLLKWLNEFIDRIEPDIVYTGINHGPVYDLIVSKKKQMSFLFGKWNELYSEFSLRKKLYSPFRKLYLKRIWRHDLDFLLAIGERSMNYYRDFVSSNSKIFFYPYYEDSCKSEISKSAKHPIVFLFSGRLQKRNNIKNISRAIIELQRKYPGKFKFIISASGEEKRSLDLVEENFPGQDIISYDIDFDRWDDRLRPFMNSHVLVVPSYSSGWGLVVNEAMNLGLPVISTKYVEAARYLVEHMINGMLIKCSWKAIFDSLEYFILNPEEIDRMSKNALKIDGKYSLEIGAERLYEIFKFLVSQKKAL